MIIFRRKKIFIYTNLFKSDSLSIDIESLFCFEHAEFGLEHVVVIKRPALLSTKQKYYIEFFMKNINDKILVLITDM